jgi:hypothetical protein
LRCARGLAAATSIAALLQISEEQLVERLRQIRLVPPEQRPNLP